MNTNRQKATRRDYQDSPEVNKDKESEIEFSVEGETEDEDVVREGLKIPVDRVECVRGKGCRN
jgi:hypothetical protein